MGAGGTFADPGLWKANSFPSLKPRLIVHLEAAITDLELASVFTRDKAQLDRFCPDHPHKDAHAESVTLYAAACLATDRSSCPMFVDRRCRSCANHADGGTATACKGSGRSTATRS